MNEIAQQTRNYSELAGRTQPVVGDILMSLINLGIGFKDLDVSEILFYAVQMVKSN